MTFIAVTDSIAKTPLYFTGSGNFTLVASRYRSAAQEFKSRADAERAVKPWNNLGSKWRVISDDVKTNPLRRSKKRARGVASPSLTRAKSLYTRFTGQPAVVTGSVRKITIPSAAVAIGYLDAVDYETMRNGRVQRFRHKFAKQARPLFCVSPDGRQLLILGGDYRFTNRGIVDRKR